MTGPKAVSKVVGQGADFLMLRINKGKIARINPLRGVPNLSSSLYIPASLSDATQFQFFARQKSEWYWRISPTARFW